MHIANAKPTGLILHSFSASGSRNTSMKRHRKQAAGEERLGKQPCLLLTGPICPLHLDQHEGVCGGHYIPFITSSQSALIATNYSNINLDLARFSWESVATGDSGRICTTECPSWTRICLQNHLNVPEGVLGSQWSHSFLKEQKPELLGWKWIPCFHSRGCGISEKCEGGFFFEREVRRRKVQCDHRK